MPYKRRRIQLYKLKITAQEMDDICFVGDRYHWSQKLAEVCKIGTNDIPEHVAWEMVRSFEEDTEGGHSYFPMLCMDSQLAEKLFNFIDSIV
jgi:hypothetical protein